MSPTFRFGVCERSNYVWKLKLGQECSTFSQSTPVFSTKNENNLFSPNKNYKTKPHIPSTPFRWSFHSIFLLGWWKKRFYSPPWNVASTHRLLPEMQSASRPGFSGTLCPIWSWWSFHQCRTRQSKKYEMFEHILVSILNEIFTFALETTPFAVKTNSLPDPVVSQVCSALAAGIIFIFLQSSDCTGELVRLDDCFSFVGSDWCIAWLDGSGSKIISWKYLLCNISRTSPWNALYSLFWTKTKPLRADALAPSCLTLTELSLRFAWRETKDNRNKIL